MLKHVEVPPFEHIQQGELTWRHIHSNKEHRYVVDRPVDIILASQLLELLLEQFLSLGISLNLGPLTFG